MLVPALYLVLWAGESLVREACGLLRLYLSRMSSSLWRTPGRAISSSYLPLYLTRAITWCIPFSRITFLVGALLARNTLLVVVVAAFKLINNRRGHMSQSPLKVVINNVRDAFVYHRDEGDFGFNLWQFIEKDLFNMASDCLIRR